MGTNKIEELRQELQILKDKQNEQKEIQRLKQEIRKTKAEMNPLNKIIKNIKGVMNGNK